MPRAIAGELYLPEDSLKQQHKSRRWELHLVTQVGNVKHMQHHAWPAQHRKRLLLVRDEVTHHDVADANNSFTSLGCEIHNKQVEPDFLSSPFNV